ncbi:uncharacterized protein LOC132720436 [Ruditapes philippinarum]|uniref:uncharacterized protein LOC132720436 n=1 Tax=Ruditapes philippinarum TaxID=129788 RepID=UPI00295A68DB|nr:uncharacterized protein LOC132720436 [Ruditapes philippinarum]
MTAKIVPSYIKTKTGRIYLFSAIIAHIENDQAFKHNQTQNITEVSPTAIVTGWEHKSGSSYDFKCCFRLKNGMFVSVLSWNKSHWVYFLENFNLQAKQFKCPVNFDIKDISSITILADKNATCPEENVFYITPTIIKHNKSPKNIRSRNVGVCVKLTYGSLDAQRLIEWFEIHKLFGVDKVIAYTYQLNSKAAKVLKFYERSGMAQVYDFDFPEKDIIKRNIGENSQYLNDEQVVLFDCQERLRNYDYVAVVDTDEFLLPRTKHFKNAWKIYFENKLRKENVGALFFCVRIHAYTWGPSNKSHPLHIGRYSNCTFPMNDRNKGVYMPSRIRQGSVWTHGAYPLQGFTSYVVANVSEAVIHHYRHCREEWLNTTSTHVSRSEMYLFHMTNTTKCTDFRRSHSDVIGQLADNIKDDVFRRLEEIEL